MIELNAEGFAQNRFQVGIGRQLGEHVRLDLVVMRRWL